MRSVRNCAVAVVGGCGFLGSHAVRHLVEDRGCEVIAIDNLVAGRREFLHPEARFVHHDITGSEIFLRRLFEEHGVRFVLNAAAYPYIPDSFARPLHVFNVNATGALHVINAAQEAGCEGILQYSSAELLGDGWGDGSDRPLAEDAPVRPHSSYGAAKAAIDAMVQVRWREAKTPCVALRQFNALGENDLQHPYIVPEIISQLEAWRKDANLAERVRRLPLAGGDLMNGPPVVMLGNNSYRDFLYAGDQARMSVELLEKGQFGEVYNLGSESGIRIYDLAKLVGQLMGFEDVRVEQDPAKVRPWEIWHLRSDNAKIYSVIESRPTVGLEEALRRTIASFRANGSRWGWER